jgi:hypothetical protein
VWSTGRRTSGCSFSWAGEKHCRKLAAGDLEEEHTHLDSSSRSRLCSRLVQGSASCELHCTVTPARCAHQGWLSRMMIAREWGKWWWWIGAIAIMCNWQPWAHTVS